ncbi:hypothetical protein D7V88_41090 [Corallococcus terminator]|uniref:Uncharacterized protein n=1 Tax=Corallococcus terminator TaxID=2316733 RepID=A0A3A8HQN1_9BACT|nr:hypothetical protein D7V88_41090 [Corallococcus terminator]
MRLKRFIDERMNEPAALKEADIASQALQDIGTYFDLPSDQRLVLESERRLLAKQVRSLVEDDEMTHREHLRAIFSDYVKALQAPKA